MQPDGNRADTALQYGREGRASVPWPLDTALLRGERKDVPQTCSAALPEAGNLVWK